LDLGRHGTFEAVRLEFFEDVAGFAGVVGSVEVTEPFFDRRIQPVSATDPVK
jgi:hypothetical protein